MLDQSFSAENFFRIFHVENRKGTFNRDLLSEEYLLVHEKVKHLFSERSRLGKNEFKIALTDLNDQKDEALKKHLQIISESCNSRSFKFKLSKTILDGKELFTVNHDPSSFFAMKQLQFNIHRTFKVKQSNRYELVKQLRILLEDGFPKILIRIDIRGFYESIPQDSLVSKIEENQLLNYHSKRLLKSLIYSYEQSKDTKLSKPSYGVPRGVGASAYLSELYMRDIDSAMKSLGDLCYYSRYVDDAVFIFIPRSKDKIANYLQYIKDILAAHHLALKDGSDGGSNKVFSIDFFSQSANYDFDFLGYKFIIENRRLTELRLSKNKTEKYARRLKISVDEYNKTSKYNEKKARALLIKRIKFLTGNFHLVNNKKRIKSGIYYSNILIKDNKLVSKEFKELDLVMIDCLDKLNPNPNLQVNASTLKKKIIGRYSFHEGFYSHAGRFHGFTDVELNEIVYPWK
jgi:hypothetical protein